MAGQRTPIDRKWKYAVPQRGSTAVQVLESAWQVLREIVPEIPQAVLRLVDNRSRRGVLGYFAQSNWRKRRGSAHEIAISPELLAKPSEIVATMPHEAARAVLFEAGSKGGMGSTRYYHTKAFRDQCKALGLECNFLNTRYGWTLTQWPSARVPSKYLPVVTLLREKLPVGTGMARVLRTKGRPLPVSGHTKLVCACLRSIYVKKSMLNEGGIVCSFCEMQFRAK